MEQWKVLPLIPRDHQFKTIPLEVLDNLGWRWTSGELGMGHGYFIPYFNMDQTTIPFAQVRHLSGERRFTFLKDAEPIAYGLWNLDNGKLFLVEGPSDGAALDYCGIPWIAMPSASSTQIASKLAQYAYKQNIEIVYAGDNDEAGEQLREALDGYISYRVHQPPGDYKDWGDFLVGEGLETVTNYCNEVLFEGQ